jgi:hypothetical protein
MCEELNEELDNEDRIAKEAVEHLENMGAGQWSKTVETEDRCYIVEVRRTL